MKRRTGRLITVAQLNEAGACFHAVENFQALFGSCVKVTKTNAVKHSSDFDFGWAGSHLLSLKRSLQFDRFYSRLYKRYYLSKQTQGQTKKAIAAEFARLYNLDE